MSDFTNGLTPAEDERLSLLMEECAEVIQIAAKIQRHGYASYHPDKSPEITNRDELTKEMGDVLYSMDLMLQQGDIYRDQMINRKVQKLKDMPYLHHQERVTD